MPDRGSTTSGHLCSLLVTFSFWLCAQSCHVHLLLVCNLINCPLERLKRSGITGSLYRKAKRNMKKPVRNHDSNTANNKPIGLLCRIISDEILLCFAAEGQIASAASKVWWSSRDCRLQARDRWCMGTETYVTYVTWSFVVQFLH